MSADATKKEQIVISAKALERFIAAIFSAAGCETGEAQQVAHYLLDGNLTGHDSHGVIRTSRYVSWIGERVFPGREVSIANDSGNMVVIDGNFAFGQVVGPKAVELGVARAKKHGVAVVAVRDSGHMGRIGTWAEMAAEQGIVFISFVNVRSSLLVAPYGGTERRMSTAPFTAGIPVTGTDPIILDFATSAVAEGKALVALRGGKPLPADVLIEPNGKRSSDPRVLYGDVSPTQVANPMNGAGALRALGEHKGSGLAFLVEILAGALTGAGCAGPLPRAYANNMLAIFMDPEALNGNSGYAEEIRSYVEFFKSSRPEEAEGEVLIPGDKERALRAERLANGIPMSPGAWKDLTATALRLGLSEDDIARLTTD